MNKILFFLIFITHSPLHAMLFDFPELEPEMQCRVLDCATISGKNSKEAAYIINALSLTNWLFHNEINNQNYSDNLIKILAKKYLCSHETIAKRLCIPSSKKRLTLQYELKRLCCHPYTPADQQEQLDILISQGVDLEFTYNHCHQQKTPLMLTISCNNNTIFDVLLDYGVNVNNCNTYGITALHLACRNQHLSQVQQLLAHPKIAINQHNNTGENALLYGLIRKNWAISRRNPLYRLLLEAGSDPECTNKKGITPLRALKKLPNDHPVIILITKAIEQKHASNAIKQ